MSDGNVKKKRFGFLKPTLNDKMYTFLGKFYGFLTTTPPPKYLVSCFKSCVYLPHGINTFPNPPSPQVGFCVSVTKVFNKIFKWVAKVTSAWPGSNAARLLFYWDTGTNIAVLRYKAESWLVPYIHVLKLNQRGFKKLNSYLLNSNDRQ